MIIYGDSIMFNITETMKEVYYDKMITKNGKGSSKAIMYVTDEIQKFMDENEITLKDFLYIMKNELTDFPKCQYCGKEIRKKLYNASRYCSKSCGTYATKQMKEETCLKKYGVKDYSATDEYKNHMLEISQKRTEEEKQSIVDKRKKTMMDRYDAECALKVNKFKEKKNKTTKDRYGVENYSQTEEWKKYSSTSWTEEKKKEVAEKIKHTVNQKYGVDYYSQTEEFKENRKKKIQEKYGVDYYSQTEEWQNKIKSTSKDKYGVEYYFQSKEFLDNRKKLMKELYGVDSYFQSKDFFEHKRMKKYSSFIRILKRKHITMLSLEEDYISYKKDLQFKCDMCNHVFYDDAHTPTLICCPNCKRKFHSKKEKDVYLFVKSIYDGIVIENDRTILSGKELDIYIPDKKIAIEFDGYYWHSDLFVDRNYHLNKTLECQEKEIRLIHVFEYDWDTKEEICKSIISSALGIYERKIYARNCVVKSIDNDSYKQFLDENHIQGSVTSSFRLGLFYGKELVAVMGFGKSRFKKDEYELHRFCTKLHTQVLGGFSKLIKHSEIKEFISYVDRARFTGESYVKNGFQIVNYTKSSYVYVRNDVIFNRMSCQKHKLSNILENYDETQSEYDNMVNNGYFRIYDCGTIKVKYILDK